MTQDNYVLMKYQQSKVIEFEDHVSCVDRKMGFTDYDSNVNNNASIDDVRDYLHNPNPKELKTFRENT